MGSLTSHRARPLRGEVRVPGDKSISHRALILASLCVGRSRLCGLSKGMDVVGTQLALRNLGVNSSPMANESGKTDNLCDEIIIDGVGTGGLSSPDDVIDLGNSGTSARLLAGVVASHPIAAILTGDASLRRRPMARVFAPLREMGARFESRSGGLLPVMVHGSAHPIPIDYPLRVPSAQVKSAILLAGLNTAGQTRVRESQPTRDHTERLMRYLGVDCVQSFEAGEGMVSVKGQAELSAGDFLIPGDPSAAAFLAAAACLVPHSEIMLPGIGVNPLRMGFFEVLKEMGGDIEFSNQRMVCGEPWADIRVGSASLKGCHVKGDRAASMIDEYPILACLAACAQGESRFDDVGELRFKESDRFSGLIEGLRACGIIVEGQGDSLLIEGVREGAGDFPPGGGRIITHLDHRMAMAFLILGLVSQAPITIDDGSPIATSFPGFQPLINQLGGDIRSD